MLPLYYGAITQVRTLAVREKVFQRAGGFMRRSGQPFEKACQPTAFYHLVPARIGFLPFALIRHLADGVQPSLALLARIAHPAMRFPSRVAEAS